MMTGMLILSVASNILLAVQLWREKQRRLKKYTPQYLKYLANSDAVTKVTAANWVQELRDRGAI